MKKVIAIWATAAVALWSAAFGAEHWNLTEHPRHIVVVLDSTYPMSPTWDRARSVVEALDSERYALFAAYTDKGRIHGFQKELEIRRMTPYGPQDAENLARIARSADAAGADRVLFVTSDTAQNVPAGWDVIEVSAD